VRGITKHLGTFFSILIIFWLLSFLPTVSAVFHTVQAKVYGTGALIGRATSRFFAQEDSLSAQLNTCTNHLSAAVVRAAASEAHAQEVEEWRTLMNYQTRASASGVPARVIARDTPEESTVTIDRGTVHGIQPGSAVIIGDGVLFGIAEYVADTITTVRLTDHPKSAIPGAILNIRNTIGLVTGQEGALLAMDYIPQHSAITVDDVVVTSGLGGHIPENIVLGIVTSIIATPSAPFVQATIQPVHDSREWTAVLVLPYPENIL
jgi:rod shape-determining protein MreC